MKTPIFFLSTAALAIAASCTAIKYQLVNADMSLINLGMTKGEVINRIGKPNMVVASQRTAEGDIEVYEYMRIEYNSYTEKNEHRPIWVYFINDEVIEWGPGENWQLDNAITERLLEKYKHRRQ